MGLMGYGDLLVESFHYCTDSTVSHSAMILDADAMVCSAYYAATTISILRKRSRTVTKEE